MGITPLLQAYGAYQQGRRQRQQDTLAQQQQEAEAGLYRSEEQQYAEQNKLTEQQLAAANADTAFRKGMKTPPDFQSWTPERQFAYLLNSYRAAQGAGATGVMTETLNAMNAIPKGTEQFAHAGSYMPWQQRVQLMRDEMKTQLEKTNIMARADVKRAMISAQNRAARAGASPDERLLIGELTALNMANRQDAAHAEQAAIDQWKSDKAAYNTQAQQYALGLTSTPPQPVQPLSVYLNNAQPQAPVSVFVAGANGPQQQSFPRVPATTQKQNSGGLDEYVRHVKSIGMGLGPMLNDLKRQGANPQQLQRAAELYQLPY